MTEKPKAGMLWFPLAGVALVGGFIALARCPLTRAEAPDFSLPVVTARGEAGPDRLALRDLRGHPVLLDFWATWCGPCRMETPVLVRLHHRYRDRGLMVVGINVDEAGPRVVPPFVRSYGVDYPIVFDDGAVMGRFNVQGLPTVVLIDKQGKIRRVHAGFSSEADLAEMIEELL